MNSRILFLGTGGDAQVIGKQYRSSGGIIINLENNQFHIDPGPGSLVTAKMMAVNLRETTAVFVSKNELNSANDLNAVISAMTLDGLDKKGVLVCPSSVIIDESKKENPYLNRKYKQFLEKSINIDNTRKLAINNIEIEVIKLKDHISDAAGYKFVTQRFNMAYIPDTAYSEQMIEEMKEIDILILCVPDPKNAKRGDHMNSSDAEKIISHVKPQLAILTGFE